MSKNNRFARPWVKLSSSILHQDDLHDLTDAARSVFFYSLVRAGEEQDNGAIASSPKYMMRWCPFLESTEQAEACRDELVAAEFWVETDDSDRHELRSWNVYQEDLDNVEERRRKNADRQRRHRRRLKEQTDDDTRIEDADVRARQSAAEEDEEISKPMLREAIVEGCRAGDGSYQFFQRMLVEADDIATSAEAEGVTGSHDFLKQAVIAEAVEQMFDGRIPKKDLPQYYKTCTLPSVGYESVLWAIQESCNKTGLVEGKESRYVLKVAASHASKLNGVG